MASPAPKKDQPLVFKINLLHPQGEPLQLPGKFLKWLVGYGRFIVIFVEIIVIVCFLYRFKLDADLDRINQDIRAEAHSIDLRKNDEILIRQTQQKLQLVKQSYDNSPDWKNLVETINSKVPQGIIFSSFQLEHLQSAKALQFKIIGQASAPEQISAFVKALKEGDKEIRDRQFKDIELSGISLDATIITFTVTGSTK